MLCTHRYMISHYRRISTALRHAHYLIPSNGDNYKANFRLTLMWIKFDFHKIFIQTKSVCELEVFSRSYLCNDQFLYIIIIFICFISKFDSISFIDNLSAADMIQDDNFRKWNTCKVIENIFFYVWEYLHSGSIVIDYTFLNPMYNPKID